MIAGLARPWSDSHCDDRGLRRVRFLPVEPAGVDERAVLRDHRDDRQRERRRELGVALVVRRHGHDRAGAVLHQHVVGDPDRDALAVDGVRRVTPGEHAGLLALLALLGRTRRSDAGVRTHFVGLLGSFDQLVDELRLGRDDEERRAE